MPSRSATDRFDWISDRPDPPERWDLRRLGWRICPYASGTPDRPTPPFPVLCDYQALSATRFAAMQPLRQRMILLGVQGGMERAGLLAARFGDALPDDVDLGELAERAQRIALSAAAMPRFRQAGPALLDLFHRDGQVDGRWLGLHPREFALLWYLADHPGAITTRQQLLRDVWRINHDPGTNSVEVHVSRLRAKLADVGLAALVQTDPAGGYRIDAGGDHQPVMVWRGKDEENPLDEYVRLGNHPRSFQDAGQ